MRPWTTLSPATVGMPTSTTELPVRFATVNAMGTDQAAGCASSVHGLRPEG